MILCTAVYFAENKSFAFLDFFFLETDGKSDAILKQLELERLCKCTGVGVRGKGKYSGTEQSRPPSVLLQTEYLSEVPTIPRPLDEGDRSGTRVYQPQHS